MNIIYVDDETLQLTNFRLTIEGMAGIDSLETFGEGDAALAWAKDHPVDAAFLDIEMRGMNGIELARRFKQMDENIQIIFVTAYEQYALEAYGVDAIGYLLKPYLAEDIEKQIKRAACFRKMPKAEIQIRTMPDFVVSVNGKPVVVGRNKQEELLALLVDRGESGLLKKDAIENLWNGCSSDNIYWTTMSRLKKILDEAGASDLILTRGQTKYINTQIVDCDLYRMLKGDEKAISEYRGEYLGERFSQFEWVQERKKQLDCIKSENDSEKKSDAMIEIRNKR